MKNLNMRSNNTDGFLFTFCGLDGCGKTTMLNLIGGLDKCTSGDIFVDSKSTRDYESANSTFLTMVKWGIRL